MKVSVIIPAGGGGKYLGRLFKTLSEQTIRPVQIVVIDSSSDNVTSTICKASGVDLIRIDATTFDHGGTRNLAAAKAEGEILVFMTQDTFFRDETGLENLITPLGNPMIAASFARQIPREDANPVEAFVRYFNYSPTPTIKGIDDLPRLGVKTFFFYNVCSAIKKSAFEVVGRFPERTIMNEDMFLAVKLIMKGYKIAYQPHAIVYHSHNYPLTKQFKRYFDIGVFFNRNRWIKNLARSEREGIRYVKEMIRFFSVNGERKWVPYALADTAMRFLGYRTGLLEASLPLGIKKRISLNKNFWLDGNSSA
jgi:rhamnosyltransferase